MTKKLTDLQIAKAAREIGVEPAALKAFYVVESSGNGFLPDGRCKILFEGHIFWRQLVKLGLNPKNYALKNPNIVYEVWDKSKYVGGIGEYKRLEVAKVICKEAALKATSFGGFQIMGFNHKVCGYGTVEAFVDAMNESAEFQLNAVVKFMESQGLIRFLKDLNWKALASRFNGPKFADNQYDVKLEEAHKASLYLNKLPKNEANGGDSNSTN